MSPFTWIFQITCLATVTIWTNVNAGSSVCDRIGNNVNPSVQVGNTCYFLVKQTMTWANAQKYCTSLQCGRNYGRLAITDTPTIVQGLQTLLTAAYGGTLPSLPFWFNGLLQMDTSVEPFGGWNWANADHTPLRAMDSALWFSAVGDPNNACARADPCYTGAHCGGVYTSALGIVDECCASSYPFFCEINSCQ